MRLVYISILAALSVSAVNAQNIGTQVVSKEFIINALKPQILTRGINANQQEEKELSMQVQFEFDSDNLTYAAIKQLSPLGQALSSDQLANYKFVVEGHTDALGSDEYNMHLSERRAKSVREFLSNNFNVEQDTLTLVGRGEKALLNKQQPAAAENRRVVIRTVIE